LDRGPRAARLQRGADPALGARGPGVRARPRALRRQAAATAQVPDPPADAAPMGPDDRRVVEPSGGSPPAPRRAPRRGPRAPVERSAPGRSGRSRASGKIGRPLIGSERIGARAPVAPLWWG